MITMLLGRFWWQIPAVVALVVCVGSWRAVDVSKQRAIGETKAVAKIEKATTNAANLGKGAAAKSLAGGVQSNRRDPTTRD